MPAPVPNAVWIETHDDGSISVCFEKPFWGGKSRDRKKRATAMLRKEVKGGWRCRWCDDPIPTFRRVDANYCCEGCRKRAAQQRRRSFLCGSASLRPNPAKQPFVLTDPG